MNGASGNVESQEQDRIRLRSLRREDSGLLYDWITQRELVILNAPFQPVHETDHEGWIEKMLGKQDGIVIFVIEDIETREAVGTCQLFNIHPIHRSAELQIRIGSSLHRGRGIGPEAIRLLTRFGFDDLNLHRIYLHVFSTNDSAQRAYKKCGFNHEGTHREAAYIDGAWVDLISMGLLKGENV